MLSLNLTLEEKIGQLNLLPGYEDIVTGEATASEIGRKVMEGKVGAMLNVRSVAKIRELLPYGRSHARPALGKDRRRGRGRCLSEFEGG